MEKLRIAYLTHVLSYGGASTSLLLMLKSLMNYDYEKFVFTTSRKNPDFEHALLQYCDQIIDTTLEEIHNNQLGYTPFYRIPQYSNKGLNKFVMQLIDNKIDILHINSTVFPQVAKYVKKNTNIKIVTHIRELLIKQQIGIQQYYSISRINFSDAIIAISDNEAKFFKNHKRLIILPNPFDFDISLNSDNSFRKTHKISDNILLIGMLANFHKEKGQHIFIEILNLLKTNFPNLPQFKFVIVGFPVEEVSITHFNFKYRKQVLNLIDKYNIGNDIILEPLTLNPLSIEKDLDIIIRPAITADPWGRDIIEAFSLKKPVVASGKSDFYVKNGITGYLVENKNIEKFANQIALLISNSILRTSLGENGFNLIRNMCDLGSYGKNLDKIYSSLV